MKADSAPRVLVGYTGPIRQRHVLVPPDQFTNGYLIARYILRIQLQLQRLGVKPRDICWDVLPETSLMKVGEGRYRVRLRENN